MCLFFKRKMRETQRSSVCSAQPGRKIFISFFPSSQHYCDQNTCWTSTLGFLSVLCSKVTPCACTTWKIFARHSTDLSPIGKNPTTTGVCTRVECLSLGLDLWVLSVRLRCIIAPFVNLCHNLIVISEPQNVRACFIHAFVPRHIVSFGNPPWLNVGSHFIRHTNLMSLF